MRLSEELGKKIDRLVAKAWKPPTFTEEELKLPISMYYRSNKLASTEEYIQSFAECEKTVLKVEELKPEQVLGLITARLNELPKDYSVALAGSETSGTYSKEALVDEVKRETPLGREIVESELFNIVVLQRLIEKFESRKKHLEMA